MVFSTEEHLVLSELNKEWDQLIKENGPLQSIKENSDIQQVRAMISQAQEKAEVHPSEDDPYEEHDEQIPVRDGSTITVRIHKPRTPAKDGSPIFVVYHGGGFCIGNLYTETPLCRSFTELGGIAVNVDYRLAPEFPFPTGIDDAYDALKWVSANFEALGGNPRKGFLVGGVSAGGNFSAIISHLYRDEHLAPPLTGVYLSILPAGSAELVPERYKDVYLSRRQNQEAPILNDESIAWFEKLVKTDRSSKLKAVLSFDSHENLPPTYFQVCGLDPLRDEALIYETILREENGIKTRLDIYPGLPHGFWSFFPEAEFSKKFRADCSAGMQWLLDQSS